jgi:hypothetical protein
MYDHEDKHKLAKAIIKDLNSIPPIPPYFNFIKNLFSSNINILLNFFIVPLEERNQLDTLIDELNAFNRLKISGFYVDNINGKWVTPLKLCEKEYSKLLQSINILRAFFITRIDFLLTFTNDEFVMIYETFKQ